MASPLEPPSASDTSGSPPSPWLHGRSVDLLVGCGAWSLPLLALTAWLGQQDFLALSFGFYLLAVFCNNPHFMATIHRAYGTAEDFRKYRFFTVYITALMALTALLAHLSFAVIPWLLMVYLTWSPWHYTGQNFGLALMMARRQGMQPTKPEREAFHLAYVATYAVWFLELHAATANDPHIITLRLPLEFVRPLQGAFLLTFVLSALYSHGRLWQRYGARAMLPTGLLLGTQAVWFILPPSLKLLTGWQLPPTYYAAGIIAFMHGAQYLWVTGYYTKRETEAGQRGGGRPWNAWRYYLTLVLGGIALFIPAPWLVSLTFGFDLFTSLLIFLALVNIHHFILDGAIWKLRDGRIARLLLGSSPGEAPAAHHPETLSLRGLGQWLRSGHTLVKGLGAAFALGLVGVAAVDQTQYYLTLGTASLKELTQAEQLNPHDTRVHFQRARRLADAGDLTAAQEALARAIELNPRNAPARHLQARIWMQQGKWEQAEQAYQTMRTLFPPDFATELNLGLLALERGDPQTALADLQAAQRLQPDHAPLYPLLGQAHIALGDYPAATAAYLQHLELGGAATEPLPPRELASTAIALASLYLIEGQTETARAWLDQVASPEWQGALSPAQQAQYRQLQQALATASAPPPAQ